jgi:formamidopyrimidine-DNA glycosylase
MPELPEVETIVRRLRDGSPTFPPVPGQSIADVIITWDKIIAPPENPESFRQQLMGKTILDVRRRGKFLHFPLSRGHLIGHLRMSGDMRVERRISAQGEPLPIQTYDRVVINFTSPWRLVFVNVRKFGRMITTTDPQSIFGDLGPEPLSPDFNFQNFAARLQAHNRQIKPLLMDQGFLAGLGNIYTDEALFRAKIHPLRKSDSLSQGEVAQLNQAIQAVLREGITQFGASLDWVYRGGEFQNYFKVYGRKGEPCPICGTTIEKISVGQRGTHFCPQCQISPLLNRKSE